MRLIRRCGKGWRLVGNTKDKVVKARGHETDEKWKIRNDGLFCKVDQGLLLMHFLDLLLTHDSNLNQLSSSLFSKLIFMILGLDIMSS